MRMENRFSLLWAEPATVPACRRLSAVLTPALPSFCHCHPVKRSVHTPSSRWITSRFCSVPTKFGEMGWGWPFLPTQPPVSPMFGDLSVLECQRGLSPRTQMGTVPAGWSLSSAPTADAGKTSWASNPATAGSRTLDHPQCVSQSMQPPGVSHRWFPQDGAEIDSSPARVVSPGPTPCPYPPTPPSQFL